MAFDILFQGILELSFHGKFILDSNNVPIRRKDSSTKRNAIHVDISQYNTYASQIIAKSPNFDKIAQYVQNYKNIRERIVDEKYIIKGKSDKSAVELEKLKSESSSKFRNAIARRTSHPGRKVL